MTTTTDTNREMNELDVSIVIPVFNEEECLPLLERELDDVLTELPETAEVILVDDGSTDRSFAVLRDMASRHSWVRVIRLKRNFGQTQAMAAGFDHARGATIICMDADLQNDPRDIPQLLEQRDKGFDIVSGWRRDRQDTWLTRRIPSIVANWLIGRVCGIRLHDYGCTLKAYNARVMEALHLYSDMHRFLPALAQKSGARVTEVAVNHRPREFGQSKYGLSRIVKVALDMIVIKLVVDFSHRPAHAFGKIASWFLIAFVISAVFFVWNLLAEYRAWNVVLPTILILTAVSALYFFMLGVIGDLIVRVGRHDDSAYAKSTAIEAG